MIVPADIWQKLPPLHHVKPGYEKYGFGLIISAYKRLGYRQLIADLPAEYHADELTFQGARETVTFTADEPITVVMPTLARKAVNLFSALPGILSVSSPEVEAARLAACNGCDMLGANRACRSCGCFVDAKVKFSQEKCPLGKWMLFYS